jgi:flagellar FliL protein
MAKNEEHKEEVKAHMGTKTIIIIIAAVLLSVALTGGVVMYIMGGRNVVAATEKGGEKKGEHGKKKEEPVIYPLEAFVVNISDGHDMRYLRVKVEFDVNTGKEAKAELDPYLAPLRDSILVLLSSKNLQEIQDLPGKNRLRDEIMASAGKILPPGKVNRVYFTDFVVQ